MKPSCLNCWQHVSPGNTRNTEHSYKPWYLQVVVQTSQHFSKEIKHLIFQVGEKEAQQGYVIHLVSS